jgi:hypothetical protein
MGEIYRAKDTKLDREAIKLDVNTRIHDYEFSLPS